MASPVITGEVVDIETVDLAFSLEVLDIPADTDVTISLTNNGALPHDIAIEDTDYLSDLAGPGETVHLVVNLPAGEYTFYCSVAGHRAAGMVGTLVAS